MKDNKKIFGRLAFYTLVLKSFFWQGCSIKKESKQENTSYGMNSLYDTTTGSEGTGWGKNYKKPK